MPRNLRFQLPLLLLGLIPCGSASALDVAVEAASASATSDLAAEVQAAIDSHKERYKAFLKKWRAASKEEQVELRKNVPDATETAEKVLELVKNEAGSDVQWTGVQWAMQQGSRSASVRAACMPILLKHFPSKDEVGDLAFRMRSGEGVQAFLEELMRATDNTSVRGKAIYGLAGILRQDAAKASGAEAEKLQARCLLLFESLTADEYADVVLYRTTMLSQKAAGEVFAMKFLVTGKTAPEIEAEDIDGTVFKLSDYRGKVVMLDFWGDW